MGRRQHRRVGAQVPGQQQFQRFRDEGEPSGQHLEQHDAQAVQVRAGRHGFAADLGEAGPAIGGRYRLETLQRRTRASLLRIASSFSTPRITCLR